MTTAPAPRMSPPSMMGASWAKERGPVTGDAVELVLPPAPIGSRILSGILDVVCIYVWVIALLVLLLRIGEGWSSALAAAVGVGLVVFAFVVWPTGFETISGGRSPGKIALGLRSVRLDGGPIQFQHALARALFAFPEIHLFSGVPALTSAAMSSKHQRMGDRLAGTVVIQERIKWEIPQPPDMPPHLADWAAAADLGRIPEIWLHWSSEILTRQDMYPAARESALHDMVVGIAPWVMPPPPPASDEEIISAVLAERHRRAVRIEQKRADLRRRFVGEA